MTALLQDAVWREALISLGIVAASWLSAHALSALLGWLLTRGERRGADTLTDRLIAALKGPLHNALLLFGAYLAVHRLPIQDSLTDRLDDLLFAAWAVVITLAALRAYGILLRWYATESAAGQESPLAREFTPLLSKLGRLLIAVFALISALRHFGVDVNSLVVSLGVGSLAVGLAAQDTLANMFAGFALMLDRPFKIGDRVQLSTGEVGDVASVGMRATRLLTPDETLLIVPNSVLVKDRLVNQSQLTRLLTVRVEVSVAYGSDPARVREILVACARSSARVSKEREPVVLLTRFAEAGLGFLLVFWALDYAEAGSAKSEVQEEILRRFAEAGIEIPLPVRRVIHEGPWAPTGVR